MNIIQAVPEGVIGIVGLEIVAASRSRNSEEILSLRREFTAQVNSLREGIKTLDSCGAIDPKTAWTLFQRQLVVGRAVHDHLIHQLTVEAI